MGDPAAELIAVRHGQSLANLLLPAAEAAGQDVTGLPARDSDVPLTPLGVRQARALGEWLGDPDNQPTAVLCSPYARARETYQHALVRAALDGHMLPMSRTDDRLRDRGMGVLQLLTTATVRRRFPQEYARLTKAGPLAHRPPGGESFADVVVRVRAVLDGLRPGGRVLLVTHDSVILALRALVDGLSDDELAAVPLVPNGSVSRWRIEPGGRFRLGAYGETGHLAAA